VADPGQRELLLFLRDMRWRDVDRGSPSAESAAAGQSITADEDCSGSDLGSMARSAASCQACRLAAGRRNVVFGVGNPTARLMFIGEGPGAEEDARGEPFVGRAGQLLTAMLRAMRLNRGDIYIANIVKCRPPGNRDPEPDEAATCMPFLRGQIRLVDPEVIVLLGRVAARFLLGVTTPIGTFHGRWMQWEGRQVLPIFHPAYLLRNPAAKAQAWSDLQKLRTYWGGR